MLSLMLNPRFKSMKLVSSLINRKQVVSIVEEYDQWSLFPMFLKCYHIFHPMAKFWHVANMQTNEKNSLNILKCLLETMNQQRRWWTKNCWCLEGFKVDVKDIKCPLEWWAKHESLFPIVAFLFIKFLALLVLKYKIERKISLVGIITNLRKCHL
jgi:hypothetical protein